MFSPLFKGRSTYVLLTGVPIYQFLGAFAKLRKATINFVMSVCPSVRM